MLFQKKPDVCHETCVDTDSKKTNNVVSDLEQSETPAIVSPMDINPSKKRKQPEVSKASANLLATFLNKRKKTKKR